MDAGATAFFSTVNMVKTIVGAGMLAVPYAFKSDGILVGTALTIVGAVTSGFGLFVLAKCSKTLINPRASSFFTLCSITYPSLSLIFDFAMFVQCYGVGLSYLVLVGDLFPGVVGGTRRGWIIGSTLATVPLSLIKRLDGLKYSSILGLFAVAYLVCLILGSFLKDVVLSENYREFRGDVSWIGVYDKKGLVSTFTIIVFAFTASMNLFSIINELKDNSMQNINKVITSSISTSAALFLSVGVCGYLTFGSNVVGNIMLNYDPESIWTTIGKLCLGTMVILSFPLLLHPCRIAANNMMHWILLTYGKCEVHHEARNKHKHPTSPITMVIEDEEDRLLLGSEGNYEATVNGPSYQEVEENREDSLTEVVPFPNQRFYIITAVLVISLYVLALNVSSFALVLALVGATGSTAISFTLPGLFGYKLIGSQAARNGQLMSRSDKFLKSCSLALAIYGLAVMFLSLYVTIKYGA
ncbi:Avt7p [Lachancea thermotolerans CBS 6340]|uniref:KLTH0G10604p n=1 Tax=Lachancea thermotolerans (strain ATCC 56472 / CBS 6340 / NRRL Y-8284) TaxID=559295 RepID=C5DMP6_LACTC|nr:KLTH0G10604p [Lachancea thermotolerans CBS 6340]CAR25057.1 KLTH0G10604p [Lachancea thermotolerans CBS 6340]